MKIVRKHTEDELSQFKFLANELAELQKNPDISESGFKRLNNIVTQLAVIRDGYFIRLLNLAKQDEL